MASGISATSRTLSTNPVATAEIFDPATGVFTPTGAMGTARRSHGAVLLPNGQVLIIGGTDGSSNVVATCELYDPISGTFSGTGSDPDSTVFPGQR